MNWVFTLWLSTWYFKWGRTSAWFTSFTTMGCLRLLSSPHFWPRKCLLFHFLCNSVFHYSSIQVKSNAFFSCLFDCCLWMDVNCYPTLMVNFRRCWLFWCSWPMRTWRIRLGSCPWLFVRGRLIFGTIDFRKSTFVKRIFLLFGCFESLLPAYFVVIPLECFMQ